MSSGKIVVLLFVAIIASTAKAETSVCVAPDGHKTLTNEACKPPYDQRQVRLKEPAVSAVEQQPSARKLALEKERIAKRRELEVKRILGKRK